MFAFIRTNALIRFSIAVLLFSSTQLFSSEIKEKVLICGVCKDVEPKLKRTSAIMESIGALFEDYRVLVYENNSKDNTLSLLNDWVNQNPKIEVESENLLPEDLKRLITNVNKDGSLFVPEQIARARNKVLERVFLPEYEEFKYVIWMDMDFVRFPDLQGFIETFQSPLEWDAVFAYGIDPRKTFWDWYSFRDAMYPIGSELIGMDWWYMKKQFSLKPTDSWYPVYSGFGGCGIYKKSSIEGCLYSACVTPELEVFSKRLLQNIEHPQIAKYWKLKSQLEGIREVSLPENCSEKIENPNVGIVLKGSLDPVVWRMSTFVYQYPSTCEHVPFHASMILKGHDKLFINPRLVFRYGN